MHFNTSHIAHISNNFIVFIAIVIFIFILYFLISFANA